MRRSTDLFYLIKTFPGFELFELIEKQFLFVQPSLVYLLISQLEVSRCRYVFHSMEHINYLLDSYTLFEIT
jgi:hypothetical protein